MKWNKGGGSEAPRDCIEKEFAEPLERFLKKHGREPTTPLLQTPLPDKKKPRVEQQAQSPGACGCDHDSSTHFQAEYDGRYWDEGMTYYGVKCGACQKDCRASRRVPAYKCVDDLTMGCMEIRCKTCYLDILLQRTPKKQEEVMTESVDTTDDEDGNSDNE